MYDNRMFTILQSPTLVQHAEDLVTFGFISNIIYFFRIKIGFNNFACRSVTQV